MSERITVNVSGTFSEKQRPNNGLERVAAWLNANRLARIPIVAYAEWHTHGESRTGEKMAVTLPAIEPGVSSAGLDIPGLPVVGDLPRDAAGQIMWLLDTIRRSEGKGAVADTLFGDVGDDDEDDVPEPGRVPGEVMIPGADPVVPEASGEEIMAERAERKAAAAKQAPAAAFTPPADGPTA